MVLSDFQNIVNHFHSVFTENIMIAQFQSQNWITKCLFLSNDGPVKKIANLQLIQNCKSLLISINKSTS